MASEVGGEDQVVKSGKARFAYIDVLNVLAALSVVLLHCNGCFWTGPAQGRSWYSANLIETLFIWPVPVFFMITGATLFEYRSRMTTRQYLQRRVRRTVIPFLAWSLIGLAWYVFKARGSGAALDLSVRAIVDGILNARYTRIYWFFPPLFAVYLSLPILSYLVGHKNVLRYAALVGTLTVFVAPLACTLAGIKWNTALVPPPVAGYVTYAVLGYMLSKCELEKNQRMLIYAMGIAGWAAQFFGTLVLSSAESGIDQTFKGYANLPVLVHSVAVFVFIKSVRWDGNRIFKRISAVCGRLSMYTFGVYLIHWYLIDFCVRFGGVNKFSIGWRLGGTVFVFVASVLITAIMGKIPFVRRLVM